MLDALFENMTHSAKILICLAIILIAGFLLSRITKKLKLPNVTGYILSGILIGPFCLHLVPADVISNMDFVTDIALAFIAFNVGEYFMLSNLKKSGKKIVKPDCKVLSEGQIIYMPHTLEMDNSKKEVARLGLNEFREKYM